MTSLNDTAAHDTVEEGDDIHHGAAHIHMREVQELAISRLIVFISELLI